MAIPSSVCALRSNPLPRATSCASCRLGSGSDLRAQTLDGIAMDAGEQAAFAPFLLCRPGREAPTHGKAFGFERRQCSRNLRGLQSKRLPKAILRDRALTFEPAT